MKEVKKEKKEVGVVGARKEGTGMGPRKSRSKERPRANNNNNNNTGPSEVLSIRLRHLDENDPLILFFATAAKFERLRADQGEGERAGEDSSQKQVI